MSRKNATFTAWGVVAVTILLIALLFQRSLRSATGAEGDSDATTQEAYKLKGENIEVSDEAMKAASIRIAKIEAADVPMTLTLTGKSGLNMDTVTHVSALFGGRVTDISVGLGQPVIGPGQEGG